MDPTRKYFSNERASNVAEQSDSAVQAPAVNPMGSASRLGPDRRLFCATRKLGRQLRWSTHPHRSRSAVIKCGRPSELVALARFTSATTRNSTGLWRSRSFDVAPPSRKLSPNGSSMKLAGLHRLSHPGIVTIHDFGVHDGHVYIVSDYLQGLDLSEWLKHNSPSWHEAALIAAALADALAHAHARRTVHRDVKPANIILTSDRGPVLVDFGLGLDESAAGGRELGAVTGTPAYMAHRAGCGRGTPD